MSSPDQYFSSEVVDFVVSGSRLAGGAGAN